MLFARFWRWQRHRLPTKLLDWTKRAYVAVCFLLQPMYLRTGET